VRVWIEDWEWQCCGEPFAVGDEIEWGLLPDGDRSYLTRPLGAEVANAITHFETHHQAEDDEQPTATRGRVESIEAAYWHLAPRPGEDPRVLYPVEETGVLASRVTADGWEPERADGRTFEGYIVTLTPLSGDGS
jgi:hypothetical protein